jgi:hypothetical protein
MKPDWKDAPEWANWLFWDHYPECWIWSNERPKWSFIHWRWSPIGPYQFVHGKIPYGGNGYKSLERRP